MDYLYCAILVYFTGLCHYTMCNVVELGEYCIGETFNPQCQENEVIIIQEATFGRVRIGRCATRDYGITGCYNDELQQADRMCSGRDQCEIDVPDMDMKQRLACLEDLSPHLVASYSCQTVTSPGKQKCHSPQVTKVGKSAMFLSSHVTAETLCGLHDTPWVLNTQKGQRINLTLIDFSWTNDTSGGTCTHNYGYILDTENDDVINICSGKSRQKQLYLSKGSTVQIILQKFVLDSNNFLIEYKAVGCPEYKAPDHTWQERFNNTLTVGCLTDSQTWKLTCIDHIWLGHVENCSKVLTTTPTTVNIQTEGIKKDIDERFTIPAISRNHVIIFTMGCFTLLSCCCIVVTGIYYTKRCDMEIKTLQNPPQNLPVGFGDTLKSRKSVIAYKPGQQNKENPPTYTFPLTKEQCPPPVPHRTSTCRGDMSESMMSDYLAPQGGDNDSAMYYILENLDNKK